MFTGFIERCAIGALDGPTVAVKDTIDIAGFATRAGCRALEDVAPASAHAAVVDAVLAAGCRIVGKTALHELAFGMTGVNAWSGTPVNPKFPALIPGGSSSGSAAVVANGEVDFAIGTDTGGSVRMPAACCGIYGMKPTFGRIDRRGVMPERTSLDCVGPMAATMDKLIVAMAAMDPSFDVPVGMATAPVLAMPAVVADPLIMAAVSQVAAAVGTVRAIELPLLEPAFAAGLAVISAENWTACGHLLATGKIGPDVAERLQKAVNTTADDVAAAEAVRVRFIDEVDQVLAFADALILPTLPGFPMALSDALAGRIDLRSSALVRPFNLSGHPALTIPLPAIDGRPAGLQLVGRRGGDTALCALGLRVAAAIAGT